VRGQDDISKMDRFLKPRMLLVARFQSPVRSDFQYVPLRYEGSVVQPDNDNLPIIQLITSNDDDQLSRTIQQLVLPINSSAI